MEREEGITLKLTPYGDNKAIITVFTKYSSLISLMINTSRKKKFPAIASLFCLGEFIYEKKRGEIFLCREASVIEEHSFLRKRLESLTSAGVMAQAILNSHLPYKKSYETYLLFKKYLSKIEEFDNPAVLSCSFLLKLLLHEGVFNPEVFDFQELGQNFTLSEKEMFFTLALAKSFSELKKISFSPEFEAKAKSFFKFILTI
jgi:DNA repair protein RecO